MSATSIPRSLSGHSDRIREKIRLMAAPRATASEALWGHPRLGELMPWAVVRGYLIATVSIRLLDVALERAKRLDDPVAAGVAAYLVEHIPEETGHDTQILEDLESIGFSKAKVQGQIPWPSLAALLGMQYYWILHHHPVVFLGYTAIIEGSPVPVEQLDRVQQQTGLPGSLFRTLRWHSRHDTAHMAELDRTLDALPLTPEHLSLIGVNIAHTQHLFGRSVLEMIDAFDNGGLTSG